MSWFGNRPFTPSIKRQPQEHDRQAGLTVVEAEVGEGVARVVDIERRPDHAGEQAMVLLHEALQASQVVLADDQHKVERPMVLPYHQYKQSIPEGIVTPGRTSQELSQREEQGDTPQIRPAITRQPVCAEQDSLCACGSWRCDVSVGRGSGLSGLETCCRERAFQESRTAVQAQHSTSSSD